MRPITVSVGPLAAAAANNIATSQSPAGTSGRAVATFTASSASIAATNDFVAGQPVNFTNAGGARGFTANSGPAVPAGFPTGIRPGQQYYVLSAGLSGAAFEVAATPGGTAIAPASIGSGIQYVVKGPNVALNGSLVNSAGVAVLDNPRRVLITTADTTTKFTITGTAIANGPGNQTGPVQSETLVVVGGASYSVLDYATVTSITVNQAPTAALTVGTNGIASSPWVRLDEWANAQVNLQCDVQGTVNYTVQSSNDDPNDPTDPTTPPNMVWISSADGNAVGATTSILTNYSGGGAPRWVRTLLNSGTGTVKTTVIQANVANR